jgi:hypothetical protein
MGEQPNRDSRQDSSGHSDNHDGALGVMEQPLRGIRRLKNFRLMMRCRVAFVGSGPALAVDPDGDNDTG